MENHRCPPEIVEAANQLVAHNTQRTPNKQPIVATKTSNSPIKFVQFSTDEEENQSLATAIKLAGPSSWGNTAILARQNATLVPVHKALLELGVPASLSKRRNSFISPEFIWLHCCLDQILRPADRRVFAALVFSANKIWQLELDPILLVAESESSGQSYLTIWVNQATLSESEFCRSVVGHLNQFIANNTQWKRFTRVTIPLLVNENIDPDGSSDVKEDEEAWRVCVKEIRSEKGAEPDLVELVQGLALRSKSPPPVTNAVNLLSVHSAKGLEFDHVYIIGLAEDMHPSWQSKKKGDTSAEMEEERRSCFVAITRTRGTLTISTAKQYGSRNRQPSRFLREMRLLD